ncbi:MAG: lactoylglutathione lyase [Ignavibacteriae bacterium]|nr:lactoylglutathione lyase [Ignavibacteriota bacterium]
MSISHFEIILYVSDQNNSRDFYTKILQKEPDLDVPGMTEYTLADNLKLGLMPEEGIVNILKDKTPHPKSGNGIPRCELYLLVDNIVESYEAALKAGAKEISSIEERDWGDIVGYVSDFDGHVIAFAKKIDSI